MEEGALTVAGSSLLASKEMVSYAVQALLQLAKAPPRQEGSAVPTVGSGTAPTPRSPSSLDLSHVCK